MKKIILNILLCAMPLMCSAQLSSFVRKYVKHLDLSVSAGTSGFSFEASTPINEWSQIRLGGVLRPAKTYSTTLDVWRPLGMDDDDNIMQMITSVMTANPSSTIEIQGRRKMQNVKLLWDIFPIKNNHNFHVTVGIYYGNSDLVSGVNTNESFNTLTFIREYNMLYSNAQKGELMDLSGLGVTLPQDALDLLNSTVLERIRTSEDMTIPIGTYSHDIYGSDGDLLHSKGDYVMLRPDKNDVIKINAKVNNFKPFIGAGYTLPVSKDKRTFVSLDAGVLFWGGTPTVKTLVVEGNDSEGSEITTKIDLNEDVDHLTGKLGQYVRSAKNYPVYPEVSLRLTRNIW